MKKVLKFLRVLLALRNFGKLPVNQSFPGKTKPFQAAAIMMKNDYVAGNHHTLDFSTEVFMPGK